MRGKDKHMSMFGKEKTYVVFINLSLETYINTTFFISKRY